MVVCVSFTCVQFLFPTMSAQETTSSPGDACEDAQSCGLYYSDAVAQTEHKKDLLFSQKRKARYLMEHTFKTYLFIYNEAN